MPSAIKLQQLDRAQLDCRLRTAPPLPDKQLQQSIDRYGILQPLTVYQSRDLLLLGDGFKRFDSAGTINQFTCLVIPVESTGEALAAAALLRFSGREPHCVERAYGLQLTRRYADNSRQQQLLHALLHIPKRSDELHVLEMLPDWPQHTVEWLTTNCVPLSRLRAAQRCRDFLPAAFEQLAMPLQLNPNQLRRLLETAGDLITAGTAAEQLLQQLKIDTTAGPNKAQLNRELFEKLHRLRYPRFSGAAAEFEKTAGRVLPAGCSAAHGNFEQRTVSFTLQAKNSRGLEKLCCELQQAAARGATDPLFPEPPV